MDELILDNHFFDSTEPENSSKKVILVIYDIPLNQRRYKIAKLLEGYGFRVQKSAFEGILDPSRYHKLLKEISNLISDEDNVRVYRLNTSAEVASWGSPPPSEDDELIIF